MSRGMHRPITAVRCSLASEADRFIWNAIFTIKNREHASATWRTGRNCPSRTEILECFLGGVTREAYENTCDIPQCRAVTGAELTGLLAEYLSDMSDGGQCGIRVTRAVEKLEQKRNLQSQIKK